MRNEVIHITEVTNREDGSQVVRGFFMQDTSVAPAAAPGTFSGVRSFERTLTGDERDAFSPGSDYELTYTLVEKSNDSEQALPRAATPTA